MKEGVPSLLAKVAQYRPRIICFVGVGIWRTFERVIAKTAIQAQIAETLQDAIKGKSKKQATVNVGLQQYILLHGNLKDGASMTSDIPST